MFDENATRRDLENQMKKEGRIPPRTVAYAQVSRPNLWGLSLL